jgi:hypothetical protein
MPPRSLACTALPLLLAVGVAACSSDTTTELRVEIVRADGSNPVSSGAIDHARMWIREGGRATRMVESMVSGGTFDAAFALIDTSSSLHVVVELTGPTTRLIGAAPAFSFAEAPGIVRIVVGPPSTCESLTAVSLATPRVGASAATMGSFAIVAGGEPSTDALGHVEFVDLLALRVASGGLDFDAPLGRALVTPLGRSLALVLSERQAPSVVDLTTTTAPIRPVTLHPGAGLDSAVVALDGTGALVAGGSTASGAVDAVSWLDAAATVSTAQLSTPRAGAAAVWLGDRALVVGDAASGDVVARGVPTATGFALDGVDRRGAALTVFPGTRDRAFLFGGRGAGGAPRADAVAWRLCPAPCESASAPLPEGLAPLPDPARPTAWSRGVAMVSTTTSDAIAGIHWTDGGPVADRRRFAVPRGDPAVTELAAGVLLVFGGQSGDRSLSDVEVCFPPALALP